MAHARSFFHYMPEQYRSTVSCVYCGNEHPLDMNARAFIVRSLIRSQQQQCTATQQQQRSRVPTQQRSAITVERSCHQDSLMCAHRRCNRLCNVGVAPRRSSWSSSSSSSSTTCGTTTTKTTTTSSPLSMSNNCTIGHRKSLGRTFQPCMAARLCCGPLCSRLGRCYNGHAMRNRASVCFSCEIRTLS